MAVLLVTYDLNNETTRPPIVDEIRDNYPFARLSESSYAIETTKSPQQIYSDLESMLDSDDQLFVITLQQPWVGQGDKDVVEWLLGTLGDVW